ncbi:MAG: hypothetical protein EP341_03800 [Sphingomonadales bacterium]|nr:MAG: hypothetical protein EP341_03800 [Sphingomonadales bacterium]
MTIQRLYISEAETARMLGHDTKWLRDNADRLEQQFGFPKIDPATRRRHAPSIEAWASERNSVIRRGPGQLNGNSNQENENAF